MNGFVREDGFGPTPPTWRNPKRNRSGWTDKPRPVRTQTPVEFSLCEHCETVYLRSALGSSRFCPACRSVSARPNEACRPARPDLWDPKEVATFSPDPVQTWHNIRHEIRAAKEENR